MSKTIFRNQSLLALGHHQADQLPQVDPQRPHQDLRLHLLDLLLDHQQIETVSQVPINSSFVRNNWAIEI